MGAEGLKKFLTFLTGLEEVPPLGFSKKIEVKYLKDRTQTLYNNNNNNNKQQQQILLKIGK